MTSASEDPFTDRRHDHLGGQDYSEDGDQHGGHGAPLEDIDGGIQHEADAPRADQAQP